jgi:hypothetical protein
MMGALILFLFGMMWYVRDYACPYVKKCPVYDKHSMTCTKEGGQGDAEGYYCGWAKRFSEKK